MKRLSCLILVVSFLSSNIYGQGIDHTRIDSLLNHLSANNLAIGGVAVTQNGKLIYQRSFGKDQTPAIAYRIGSITKMFTAVLTYQLIDARRLSLKDTLSRYFPELPNAGKITIAQLLGHRSGLANFTNNTDYDTWKDQPRTHQELLTLIKNQKPDFEPDARADYNNSNYLLLGYIIEKITGEPYSTVVTKQIIKKIGLEHTYYGMKPGFQPGEAISYKYFDNQWKQDRAVYLDNFGGAGSIIATTADMCKFITALFGGKLISKTSLDVMKHLTDGYGKGMFPYGTDAHPGFGHNGKTEGFGSSLQYYPENGLAIAYCTNGEVYPKAIILDDIFKLCFRLPCTLPDFKPLTLADSTLNSYTGNYHTDGIDAVCTHEEGQLTVRARGQDFKTTAISVNEFWNKQYGFFFVFDEQGKRLLIKDVDDVYELFKK